MSLFDPFLVKSGILEELINVPVIEWFKGITLSFIIQNLFIPLIILIICAFVLKHKYNQKIKRKFGR